MNRQSTDKREESQKAKQLLDKDMPNDDQQAGREGSHKEEPQPFRPDENVDNQKADKNSSSPDHNTSLEAAPFSGAQLAKEKKAHKDNIDQKTDEADPKSSE
ncbi:hypothetical protein [Vreelandella sp. V005]|uniref:hypothetical protein n=1 Tax=Vreelandella sp. V005 TaxID=3459608 RepID=UPI004044C858